MDTTIIIMPANMFLKVNGIGIHKLADKDFERDLMDALDQATRDGYQTIYLYGNEFKAVDVLSAVKDWSFDGLEYVSISGENKVIITREG